MKRIFALLLLSVLFLSGCAEQRSETIEMYGRRYFCSDNRVIVLNNGYFVRDYQIDYENMTITLNLTTEVWE